MAKMDFQCSKAGRDVIRNLKDVEQRFLASKSPKTKFL